MRERVLGVIGASNIREGLKKVSEIIGSGRNACRVIMLTQGHITEQDPLPVASAPQQHAIIQCVDVGGRLTDVDEKTIDTPTSECSSG